MLVLIKTTGCFNDTGGDRKHKDPAVIAEFSLDCLSRPGEVLLLSDRDNPLKEPCLKITPSGLIRLPGASTDAPWETAHYLVFDVLHDSGVTGAVRLEFEEEKAGRVLWARLGVMPGLHTRLVFPLEALNAQTVFLPRTPGRLKCVVIGRRVRPDLLSSATIGLDSVVAGQSLYVSRIRLTSEQPTSYPMDGPPLVDSLGQWAGREWPGKTPDTQTLRNNLRKALDSAGESSFPGEWSRYGGWKKLRFKATGFFRLEKTVRRWWLVDPEGYAFFSVGVDGVDPLHAACPVEGIEPLFEWLPEEGDIFEPVRGEMWQQKSIDFAGANLIRAFGQTWRRDWARLTRSRMLEWRFNTLGNWSDQQAIAELELPYVLPMRGFPGTEKNLFRNFPDVFDPIYERKAGEFAEQLRQYRDDPLLIGYFLQNEPQWAFGGLNPAAEMLEDGEPSATRSELVRWLKSRYRDDADKLSMAWNKEFSSFEQLERGILRRADQFSDQAGEDLEEFSELMVEQYLKPVNAAVRRVDKNHLNLGIRWAGLGSRFCYLTGPFCDVFSVNMYRMLPDSAVIREVAERTGKPVMIGEYHFGATDRGLPSTGLRAASSQEDRGVAYRAYVETGAALPQLVGIHYFIWNDQPVLGRYDGENFNIGLVDVCNTPYREMVEAARLTNQRIYPVASTMVKPFAGRAERLPQVGF